MIFSHVHHFSKMNEELDLEYPLIKFHETDSRDWWRVRDAFEGVQIFGGIGSGKSSGSGKTIAKAFLKNGFGGVVLCAKPDEKEAWIEYAKETNREKDLVIFGEGSEYEFNPLEYEMTREGKGAGDVFNLTHLFMEIYKMGNRFSGGGKSGESERYWDNALKRCISNIIHLLKMAEATLSIDNMRRILSYAPSEEEARGIPNMTDDEINEWSNNNFCVLCINEAEKNLDGEESEYIYDLVTDYFLREFATLEDKARSTIIESFLGLALPFTGGILKKHFSQGTSEEVRPEETFKGKIIILDFSVKEFLQAGIYAQGIYKLLWQQAIERRDINKYPNPTFLWVDESQYFVNEYDTIFQTTARSSRACTVFLTQNISNYYSQMGGESSSKAKVDSLLGNLSTKIFHCNNDTVTNRWASNVIGEDYQIKITESQNKQTFSLFKNGTGQSKSWDLRLQVIPKMFTILKSGGESNNLKVEAVIQIKGREWSNGTNFNTVRFNQTK